MAIGGEREAAQADDQAPRSHMRRLGKWTIAPIVAAIVEDTERHRHLKVFLAFRHEQLERLFG